jgi:hypothetical protein
MEILSSYSILMLRCCNAHRLTMLAQLVEGSDHVYVDDLGEEVNRRSKMPQHGRANAVAKETTVKEASRMRAWAQRKLGEQNGPEEEVQQHDQQRRCAHEHQHNSPRRSNRDKSLVFFKLMSSVLLVSLFLPLIVFFSQSFCSITLYFIKVLSNIKYHKNTP